jgi:hypothetical protein
MDEKKRERERIKRMTKGTPGLYVQNQKSQVFEDRRTKRMRTRSVKNQSAIEEQTSATGPLEE